MERSEKPLVPEWLKAVNGGTSGGGGVAIPPSLSSSQSGLVLCLLWNMIAVTTAWIKGEGWNSRVWIHFSFWMNFQSVDLFVAFISDLPIGGQILSVAIYPSEFGHKRTEEAVRGPIALFDNERENSEDEIDNEKLRAYEMSRLRSQRFSMA